MIEALRARPRVPDDEEITRYVGGSHYDPSTGRLDEFAFDRALKDDDGLSVNRVGVLDVDVERDRAKLRAIMAGRMESKKLGRTAVFAQMNVGAAIAALEAFEQEFFVCVDPLEVEGDKPANPAHALLVGLPFKGQAIGSLDAEAAGKALRGVVTACFDAVPADR